MGAQTRHALMGASRDLQADRAMVMKAISKDASALQWASADASALQWASADLRADQAVVRAAIALDPMTIQWATAGARAAYRRGCAAQRLRRLSHALLGVLSWAWQATVS